MNYFMTSLKFFTALSEKLIESLVICYLCRVGVFVLGQAVQYAVCVQIEAEEGIEAMLWVSVRHSASGLRACGVLAGDRQTASGIIQPVIQAESRPRQSVVGRVLIGRNAERRSRCRFQEVVAVAEGQGCGGAAVSDAAGKCGHGEESKQHQRRKNKRHPSCFRMRHKSSFQLVGDEKRAPKQRPFSDAKMRLTVRRIFGWDIYLVEPGTSISFAKAANAGFSS